MSYLNHKHRVTEHAVGKFPYLAFNYAIFI